jgi:hypothetical protein
LGKEKKESTTVLGYGTLFEVSFHMATNHWLKGRDGHVVVSHGKAMIASADYLG